MPAPGYYRCVRVCEDDDVKVGELVYLTGVDDGKACGIHKVVDNTTYTFHIPVLAFESDFEFAPEGSKEKASELADAISQVEDFEIHQVELAAKLSALQESSVLSLQDTECSDTPTVASESAESALAVVGDTENRAKGLRLGAADARRSLTLAGKSLKAAQQKMKDILAEKRAIAEARLGQLKETMGVVEEVIKCVNVYLGENEIVEVVREGAPADTEDRIHIHQETLFMDEESAMFEDLAEQGGLDFENVDDFDRWLLSNPDHLQSVLPESRGVVALQPRRTAKKYSNSGDAVTDALCDAELNKKNFKTYILVRNGERLYRILSLFDCGNHLFPDREEYEQYFEETEFDWQSREHRTKFVRPGDPEYMKALKKAEKNQRRYLQALLLLQGLLDRTKIFHPILRSKVNILAPDEYADTLVFVRDGENALPSGRPQFWAWLKVVNAKLDVGHRVVGNFGYGFGGAHDRKERLNPRNCERPDSQVIYTIESRVDSHTFKIYYERGKIWTRVKRGYYTRWDEIEATRRASALLMSDDNFFLDIDAVQEDDLHYYINSRLDRKGYQSMLPLMRIALELRAEERTQEQPFRDMLIRFLETETGESTEIVAARVSAVIDWWKFSNKTHRALLSDDAKAYRMITEEYRIRRQRDAERALEQVRTDQVVASILDGHKLTEDRVLAVYHVKGKAYVAVVAANEQPLFVHEVTWKWSYGHGKVTTVRKEWQTVDKRYLRWHLLWEHEDFKQWPREVYRREHLSDPEIAALVPKILAAFETRKAKESFSNWAGEMESPHYAPLALLYCHKSRMFTMVSSDFVPLADFTPSCQLGRHTHYTTDRVSINWIRKGKDIEIKPCFWQCHKMEFRYRSFDDGQAREWKDRREFWEGGTSRESTQVSGVLRIRVNDNNGVVLWRSQENIETFYKSIETTEARASVCRAMAKGRDLILSRVGHVLRERYWETAHVRFIQDGGLEEDWGDVKAKGTYGSPPQITQDFRHRLTYLIDLGLRVEDCEGLTTDHIYAESNRRGYNDQVWDTDNFGRSSKPEAEPPLRTVPLDVKSDEAEDGEDAE